MVNLILILLYLKHIFNKGNKPTNVLIFQFDNFPLFLGYR